jgi:DNA polymerase V
LSFPLPPGLPLPWREAPSPLLCPLALEAVSAGFPSPADDYIESRIDLNVELIPRPLSTFFMRVSGDAMRGDGIVDGDLLVIDRSVLARPGMVVVVVHDGAFLLRRLQRRGAGLWLLASDGVSPPLPLADAESAADGAELWGVVLHAVHHLATAASRQARHAGTPSHPSMVDV